MVPRFGFVVVAVALLFGASACSWTSGPSDDAHVSSEEADDGALVRVPVATNTSVTLAYVRLREAGLRVEIPAPFTVTSLWEPSPVKQTPRSGSRVPRDWVVTLTLGGGPLGSPGWKPHTVTVPNLVGVSASEAVRWIQDADLFYEIPDIPPLLPSDAANLLDAYRVTEQSPAPGAPLSPGVLGEEGGFRPTPVILSVAACTRRGLAIPCGGGTPLPP